MNKPTLSLKGVGSEATTALATAGVQIEEGDRPDIQLVSEGGLSEIAALESFMKEVVTIRLSQSINPNDTPYAIVTCNNVQGRAQIPRGVPVKVRREIVEILARMKEYRYVQRPVTMGDLEAGNQLYQSVGWVYPFELIQDSNPKGRAWLDNIMAEPG